MKHWMLAPLLVLSLPTAILAQAGQMARASDTAERISNATAAAPAFVSGKAKVVEWPAGEGQTFQVLRDGDNGWTCLPDLPSTQGNDPMCLDAPWMAWIEAYSKGEPPRISGTGVGYMLAPGGTSGSATDPFATGPAADNQWGHDGPHIMIVVPDASHLGGLPTGRTDGPFVMWAGSPYAHVMIPTEAPM